MPDTLIPPTRRFNGPSSGPGKWFAIASRWIHRNFTRENLVQCFKTIASVGPLTVLIWIYAEREQVRHEPDIAISIEVRCNDPRRIVSLKKPYPDKVVVAELDGPPSTLDAVVARLQRHSGDEPAVEILIDPTLEPGKIHEIDTDQALASNPIFRGVTIPKEGCQPSKLEVYMDELEERDVEVQPPPGITNLVGPPVFTPRTVKVRGPKESIEELEKLHKLVAEADLESFDAMNVPGAHDFPVVRIKPLEDPNLTFNPPNVEAAVSVRDSDVSGIIRSVPIWVYGPPDVMARYKVDLGKVTVLTNVKVSGPADKIELVNRPDFYPKPHALLEITGDDEASKSITRRLRFDLPPDLGLRVIDDVSQQTINFGLIELPKAE